MLDDKTQAALDLIRTNNLDINPELIAEAEAGKVMLGVLQFDGAALSTLRQQIAAQHQRLLTCDQADVGAICAHIGRLQGDLLYGEYYQARPVVYVQARA